MRPNQWIRVVILGVLIASLGIPPDAVTARAAQQAGPQNPVPAQQPEPAKPPTGQQQQGQPQQGAPPPQVAISVESNLVHVDAVVTDQDGNLITGLKKENFRILDGNVPQQITNFAPSEAPITIVILMEFSRVGSTWGYFGYKAREWAYSFLRELNDKDWVAFKTFSMNTTLQVDFTHNREEVAQSIASLFYPDFREANVYDALFETIDQLRDVRGKKSILLLTTGIDTFSKHTLDQTYKLMRETEVSVFCIGMGEEIDLYSRKGGGVGYLQAKNQLTQFAEMTGGYAWFPRFPGEMAEIFNSVAAFLRNQYTVGFSPSTPQDGKYHKLKVEVVDEHGDPFQVVDKKGKMKKVVVYARQGYKASAPVGD
jgi:VWFA-related protein